MKTKKNGIVYAENGNCQIILGKYETDERAKEVFEQIIQGSCNDCIVLYRMPEE